MLNQFLWIIYPYLCVAILSLVILLDINMISFHGLQNRVSFRKQLKWGSLLFHLGIIPVFLVMWWVSYSSKMDRWTWHKRKYISLWSCLYW